MHEDCLMGNVEAVLEIMSIFPDSVNSVLGEQQWTPLHCACQRGHKDVVLVLLANNAHLERKDKYQRTPLHLACEKGRTDVVLVLLANHANLEARDKDQWTPLHSACMGGHKEVVSVLLANNANLEALAIGQLTPLHLACIYGHKDVVSVLLANNANLEAQNQNKKTPLQLALERGHKYTAAFIEDHLETKKIEPQVMGTSEEKDDGAVVMSKEIDEHTKEEEQEKREEEERKRGEALELRIQHAIHGEKKGTLQKEALKTIMEACEEAELAAQENPLAKQTGHWAQSEEVQQAIDLADKMILAALEHAAKKPEKQKKKKKKNQPKTQHKRLEFIKKKSKKAAETVMGASEEKDGGAVVMSKEIDEHMKELLIQCEEDMKNAQQKGSSDKIEDVEKELREMLKKEKQEMSNCLRMMEENLMEAKKEDLGDFYSTYKENEERWTQKVEEFRDLQIEHKAKLLKMENPIHFELFQIQEENISFFRRIFKRKLSIRLIGYKAISVGTARRKQGQVEGILEAVNKVVADFCPFPGGTIAMTALQALYSLNENRKSRNRASNMNQLQGEFSASDPLEGLNDFACDVTELATEQFSSIVRFLDTKSIKKLARVAVYAMFSVGIKKLEKKEEKEIATNNPADYFVAGTFNFKIKLYNINKFFDARVLKGEGKYLTDNVGLNWKINVVDVLRNGTIRRPQKKKAGSMDDSYKKIYGSVDNSHKGLLNCDVPFVFVRPLRESSLPFFERKCKFVEMDVSVSNCVEVKKEESSSSIQKHVISPLWNSGVVQFVINGARIVTNNFDKIENIIS